MSFASELYMGKHIFFFSTTSDGKRTRNEYIDKLMSYDDAFTYVSNFYTDKRKAIAASENFKSGRRLPVGANIFLTPN